MNKYSQLEGDQLVEHFSNYLIDSWSYSRVACFARNEKAFQMKYLYGCDEKSSSSTIAGQAYHASLEAYFNKKKEGESLDIVQLEQVAFSHIDEVPADKWKIQKTTPTIEDCKVNAVKVVSQLIRNFYQEKAIYENDIDEILGVELKLVTWICVNGVAIPLPCSMALDLVVRLKNGHIVIIDHKSKKSFTDEKDAKFTIGKQAITYVLGYEEVMCITVDEVWFVENKYSANKDKSAQLIAHKVTLDKDTRLLYEALLYEPLRRMLQAVNDPDYVYMINDNDSLSDKAEIYDFWTKTMIAEVEDFNIRENKIPLIRERLRKIRNAIIATASPNVLRNFKKFTESFIPYDLSNKNMTPQEKIEHVLRSFGVITQVQHIFDGYSSASYLLEMNAGVSISSIYKYRLDIANALGVSNVRIHKELFVYEGKSYLVVESGKKTTGTLHWDQSRLVDGKIPLGEDNFKQTIYWDTNNQSTPHMLVCGATGSGKSVELRSIIEYAHVMGMDEIYICDPKFEFTSYSSRSGVTVVNEIEDIEALMESLVEDMQHRVKNGSRKKTLVVFDEFADAVANSKKGNELDITEMVQVGFYAPRKLKGMFGETMSEPEPKMGLKVVGRKNSLEENLRILLQKGRSSGFRIIAATQRASTKVITGDAKVNFPVQICFRVPKDIDSIVVLDEPGAESLNGRGDGLIKSPEYPNVVRFQAFYKE